jgi:hypothetical protein
VAIRNDLTVDWSQSPRIITVAYPSTEITMQDLYDTLRVLEAGFDAIDEPFIVDAGGKEQLGGGVLVGLTVTLQNALLAFEARSGPSFVQCRVSGGNLVAIDDVGDYFSSPIYPTAYTQIVLANSSSATLQEQGAIQYSSFGGGVSVDVLSPYSGTEFPVGTPEKPVNNMTDADLIATERGFNKFFVRGSLNLSSGLNVTGHIFEGQNANLSVIAVDDAAVVTNCTFQECALTGVLDGGSLVRNSVIYDLYYVNGVLHLCMINPGVITLGGTSTAHFLDCKSGVPGQLTPTIDFGVGDTSLAMRGYDGGILLRNKTGVGLVSIDLASGQVRIDLDTVVNGQITVRGDGKVVDHATGDWLPSGTYGGMTLINETSYGTMLQELWTLQGLDKDNPMTVTPTTREAGVISQTISGDGQTSTTVTRQ